MNLNYDEITSIVTQLDEVCWKCDGAGRYEGAQPLPADWIGPAGELLNPRQCGICDGRGRLLTDPGKKLVAWLRCWHETAP